MAYNRGMMARVLGGLVLTLALLPVRADAQGPLPGATPPTVEERLEAREVWLRQLLLQRLQSEEQCAAEIARLARDNARLRQEVQRLTPKPEGGR